MSARWPWWRTAGPVSTVALLVTVLLAGTTAAETLAGGDPSDEPVPPATVAPTTMAPAPPTTPATTAPPTTLSAEPPATTAPTPPVPDQPTVTHDGGPGPDASAAPSSESDRSGAEGFGSGAVTLSVSPESQAVAAFGTATFDVAVDAGEFDLSGVTVDAGAFPECDQVIGDLDAFDSTSYLCEVENVTASFTLELSVSATIGVDAALAEGGVAVGDSITAEVLVASIDIAKGPDPTVVGEDGVAEFTITVTNDGDVRVFDLLVFDELVPDCDREVPHPDLSGGDLDPGESVSYQCQDTDVLEPYVNQVGVFGEFVALSGEGATLGTVSDEDLAEVVLDDPGGTPSIAVTKSPDLQTVPFLGDATFEITVTNDGEVPLDELAVDDPLTPDCSRDAEALTGGGSLLPDESVTYSCAATGLTAGFTNTATASGSVIDVVTVEDSDTAEVEVSAPVAPAVTITKTAVTPAVLPGEDAVFSITVENTGEGDVTDLSVSDPLVGDCDRTWDELNKGGPLSPGDTVTYLCTAAFGTDFDDDFVNTATVSGSGDLYGEPLPVDDADTAAVDVRFPDLRITKQALPPVVEAGDDVVFVIVVTNPGELGLDVVVRDPSAPGCSRTLGRIAAGASRTITCRLSGVTTSLVNVATATGTRTFTESASAAELVGTVSVTATANATVTVAPPGVDPPPPAPPPPAPPTVIVVTPGPVTEDPEVAGPPSSTTTTAAPDGEPGDPSVSVAVDEPVTVLIGSFVRLQGESPVDCPLVLRLNGEEVDRAAAGSGFTFDVPTAGLAAGPHTAEVACEDGTTIFSRELRVVGVSSPRSAAQPILIFVALLVALAVVALFGARPAPTEQSTDTSEKPA